MYIMDHDLAYTLPNVRRSRSMKENPRRSKVKDALAAEAIRYKKFKDFADRYWNDCSRGIYWYGTSDPSFRFGQFERKRAAQKKFILHCSPEEATKRGEKYAVEMNVNGLRMGMMNILRTEAGAEVRVTGGLDAIRVMRIMTRDKAIRSYRYALGLLPSSKTELYKFWKSAWQKHKAAEDKRIKSEIRKAKLEKKRTERLEKRESKPPKRAAKKVSKKVPKKAAKKRARSSPYKALNPSSMRPQLIPPEVNVPGVDLDV
jgi:hypothetical protein